MRAKHRRFAEEMLIDDIGYKAAVRAGYQEGDCANTQASRLLARPDVQAYLVELKEAQKKRTEITADKVLEQYRRLAFSDIQDYYHIEYELRHMYYSRSDSPEYRKEERTKNRLKRYCGRVISEATYNELSLKHQAFYLPDEVLKPFDLLTKEQRAAIAGLTYDKNGKPVLKLSSKETSLDALSKHLGIFEKDNRQKGTLRIGKITRTIVDPDNA